MEGKWLALLCLSVCFCATALGSMDHELFEDDEIEARSSIRKKVLKELPLTEMASIEALVPPEEKPVMLETVLPQEKPVDEVQVQVQQQVEGVVLTQVSSSGVKVTEAPISTTETIIVAEKIDVEGQVHVQEEVKPKYEVKLSEKIPVISHVPERLPTSVEESLQDSFCERVVPHQPGHITKFIGRHYSPKANTTVELYLRQGKHPNELEGIFKNVREVCNYKEERCLGGCPCERTINADYIQNNVLNIQCKVNSWFDIISERYRYKKKGPFDVEYLQAARSIYNWVPFGYQKQLVEYLREGKDLSQPTPIQVSSRHPACTYYFTARIASLRTPKGDDDLDVMENLGEAPLNNKGEMYVVDGYSNDTLCDYLLLGKRFEHRLKFLLDKEGLTLRKWRSSFTGTKGYFYNTELEFVEFLPTVGENRKLFEDRRLPEFLRASPDNICKLLPFKNNLDTKVKVAVQVREQNIDLDLLLRPSVGNCKYALVKVLPPSEESFKRISKMQPALLRLINKPGVVSFNENGALLLEFLGGDRLEYYVDFHERDVFIQSVRLDLESINRVISALNRSEFIATTFANEDFVAPFHSFHRLFPQAHHLNCLDSSPICSIMMNVTAIQENSDGREEYELVVKNKILKYNKKLESFSSEFKIQEPIEGEVVVKEMSLQAAFVDFVERDVEAFKLFGEAVNDEWFSDQFSPYDLSVF